MISADAIERLLSLLWQVTWQGTIFALLVGLLCAVVRLPASVRSTLWLLVGIKFVGGFMWAACSAPRIPVPLPSSVLAIAPLSSLRHDIWAMGRVSLICTWLVGVSVCLIFMVRRLGHTYRIARNASLYNEPFLSTMMQELVQRLQISAFQIPSLRKAESSQTPQVTLIGTHPAILLPASLLPPAAEALEESELRLIVAHELAHVRRGDLWAGLLFAAAQILFFFHPCALWARHEWDAAREEACDALALDVCATGDRDTAARYGALLLRFVGGRPVMNASTAGISSPYFSLRRRLRHLGTDQMASFSPRSSITLLLVSTMLALCFLPIQPVLVRPASKPNPVARLMPSAPAVIRVADRAEPIVKRPIQSPVRVERRQWERSISLPAPTRSRAAKVVIVVKRAPSAQKTTGPILSTVVTEALDFAAPATTIALATVPGSADGDSQAFIPNTSAPPAVISTDDAVATDNPQRGNSSASSRQSDSETSRLSGIIMEGRSVIRAARSTAAVTSPTVIPMPVPSGTPPPIPMTAPVAETKTPNVPPIEPPLKGSGMPRNR